MSDDFASIRESVRDLERRVLAVHARVNGNPDMQPLLAIAESIGTFAEMLTVYGAFVSMMEKAYPVAETTRA